MGLGRKKKGKKKKKGTTKKMVASTLSRAPASAGTRKVRTMTDLADFFNRQRRT